MATEEELDTGKTVQDAYDHEEYVDGEAELNGDTTPPVQAFGSQGASIVDLFQQEQQELASAQSVFIPVKGYEKTGLQIQYRMPESGKELDLIATKVSRQAKDAYTRNLYMSMDTILHLCTGIYVQPEDVPEPVMLDPNETGEACGFDLTLADMMGMSAVSENGKEVTQRQVLKRLFGDNDLAIITHAERLNRWLQNTKADLNAELWQLGE